MGIYMLEQNGQQFEENIRFIFVMIEFPLSEPLITQFINFHVNTRPVHDKSNPMYISHIFNDTLKS